MLHLLIKMTAERDGFGDVLAEGSDYLAHQAGVPELAVTVNGLDVPMHDPRAFAGMAAIYALSPRGACHVQGDVYSLDTGMSLEENLGLNAGDRFESSHEKGKIAARQLAWRNLYNALSLCIFLNPGAELLSTALESITGIARSPEALMRSGQRIMALKRLLNIRLGWSRAHDNIPDLLLQPLTGGTEGHVPDLERLLEGSYTELHWDIKSGVPLKEVVDKLLL
jgi:aldehyde:ferredoxin oxidoreductase